MPGKKKIIKKLIKKVTKKVSKKVSKKTAKPIVIFTERIPNTRCCESKLISEQTSRPIIMMQPLPVIPVQKLNFASQTEPKSSFTLETQTENLPNFAVENEPIEPLPALEKVNKTNTNKIKLLINLFDVLKVQMSEEDAKKITASYDSDFISQKTIKERISKEKNLLKERNLLKKKI